MEDLNSLAANLLSGEDRTVTQDLKKAVELFTFATQEGHAIALKNLALLGGWFYSGVSPCPKDVEQGIAILKMTAKLGDERAIHNLSVVEAEMSKDSKTDIESFTFARELCDLSSKRSLAISMLKNGGQAEIVTINEAIRLLEACYDAGMKFVLEDFNTIAGNFLTGKQGYRKNIDLSLRLFAYAAQNGHQGARDNLRTVANHLLAWQKFEINYGIEQNITKGLKLLHYLTYTLHDKAAAEQLMQIRTFRVPVPMPKPSKKAEPKLVLNDLEIFAPTAEEPFSPCTLEFLKENNISISERGISMGGACNLSPATISQFKAKRNDQKWKHFTSVLEVLQSHVQPEPIQETIFGYLQSEIHPIFFQYKNAIRNLEKDPTLECLNSQLILEPQSEPTSKPRKD